MTLVRGMGAGFLAGAIAALGHAPFGLWPLALLGFGAAIWLVSRHVAPGRVAWSVGTGYFGVALHWIVEPFLVDAATHGWMAPGALVLMAGGLALFWALAGWLSPRLGGNRAVTFALLLALAEMVRGYIFTGFPWALPGYIWADVGPMAVAALIGPYGLTAVTLLVCALPVSLEFHRKNVLPAIASIATVFLMVGYGVFAQRENVAGGGTIIRLVQPNVPQNEKWDRDRVPVHIERLISATGAEGAPDLIVWPESAVAYPLDLADPILDRAAAEAGGATVITGINRRTPDNEWFNALAVVRPDGLVSETYDKVHLVPFGEYIPGRIDLLRQMASITGFGFTAGDGFRLIDTPAGRALPLICYEAIFPRHASALTERPDYILQITNDAWFGTFAGPFQHLQQAQFRAVEMGVPLVRAANTGVSAVIDARGNVTHTLGLGEQGHLDVALPGRLPPTLYARIGDLPVALVLLVTIGLLSFAGRRSGLANT